MRNFKDRVALVTGAGRGIGRACALALAKEGCRVVITSRTAAELEKVAEEIREIGQPVLCFPADISQETGVQALFEKTRATFGSVEILVNNAGIFHAARVPEHSVANWDAVMGVNARGTFLCSREVFRDRRPASIINISSLSGVRGTEKFAGLSSYVASKFAVIGITEALAVEGKEFGIRVNCVAPGAVQTEMLRKAAPHLKTHTTPEQIAQTVVDLADASRSSHLNGSVIEVYSNVN